MMFVAFTAPNRHLRHLAKEFPELDIWWSDHVSQPNYQLVEAWVCNPSTNNVISYENFEGLPSLKYLVTPSTGTNHINMKAAEMFDVKVLSLLDDRQGLSEIRASSEFTFQLILHALHRPFQQFKGYERDDDNMRGHELFGKLVGIVGYGRIGRNIGKWAKAFGADFITYDVYSKPKDLNKIFEKCDIVVLSIALTDATMGLITKQHLELMKPGTILVNTARAEIVNEQDLVEWAKKGMNTYATDVLHGEVTNDHINSPLLEMANVIVTPHLAGLTIESNTKAARIALKLLRNEIENEA